MNAEDVRGASATEKRLVDLHPHEFAFFKDTFLWGGGEGVYLRYGYEAETVGGRVYQKWTPFKARGQWQKLYPELVDSLAEKHLDFERFTRTRRAKDRLRPDEWESAFWVGTTAGRRTRTHAIDIDAHEYIGWNLLPTRWHPSRTGWAPGPWSDRYVPVVRPTLRFFTVAKVVHDHFPNRVWAFSSGNLGLCVWRLFPEPRPTHQIQVQQARRLAAVGLPTLEHYPVPARTSGSAGRCHRRPCGLDSGVITPCGVITDPVEQIRWFMNPTATPTFEQILAAYWAELDRVYDRFLIAGGSLDHKSLSTGARQQLVGECRDVIRQVKEWAKGGYLIDKGVLAGEWGGAESVVNDSSDLLPITAPTHRSHVLRGSFTVDETAGDTDAALSLFRSVDLPAIVERGLWLPFVRFLVEHGIPTEDKFFDVVSTLAKWFGFIELYGHERSRVKEVIKRYVLTRDNGKVSRLLGGDERDTLSQVDRIVDRVLDSEQPSGHDFFKELRRKRASGEYRDVWQFAPRIVVNSPTSLPSPSPTSHLLCGSLTRQESASRKSDSEWVYEPDDTPLPDFVTERIRDAFRRRKRQLRRNRDGRYPTMVAITRFVNYLRSGKSPGQRRASQQLLFQMGFPTNGKARGAIFRVLVREEIVQKGGYRALDQSRSWTLNPSLTKEPADQRSST